MSHSSTPRPTKKPTAETYDELQFAYDVFNKHLFDGQLPECLLTLQRENATYGYFSPKRFINARGETIDEMSLNPTYFAVVPLVEVMQTIVHEMHHQWQLYFGTPGRGRYHNREWARKMEENGLMPSSTGQPGGSKTGDHMMDYPIEGGRFLQVCREHLLTQQFQISWYDRFPSSQAIHAAQHTQALSHGLNLPEEYTVAPVGGGGGMSLPETSQLAGSGSDAIQVEGFIPPAPPTRSKNKYSCGCTPPINIWAKPNLAIRCEVCQELFTMIS